MKIEPINYNSDEGHPEDELYRVKTFINELSKVQNMYFDNFIKKYNVTGDTESYIFDYVFNEDASLTFEEYVDEEVWKKR